MYIFMCSYQTEHIVYTCTYITSYLLFTKGHQCHAGVYIINKKQDITII